MDEDNLYEIADHCALATWFFAFVKEHKTEVPREDLAKLHTHFERLQALFEEEANPANPLKSRW